MTSDRASYRGSITNPSTPLDKLVNVKGAILKTSEDKSTGTVIAMPVVCQALQLLQEDPVSESRFEDLCSSCPVNTKWAAHLKYLWDVGVLEPYVHVAGSRGPILSRYFGVNKTENLARAIFDLRELNSMSSNSTIAFSLLNIEDMLQVLSSTDTSLCRLRAIHFDIRNAYYQIPIGIALRRRCCVRLGNIVLQACVLPMGYSKACGICQALVWGVLLNLTHAERVELHVPQEVLSWKEAPSVLRLEDGGFYSSIRFSLYARLCLLPETLGTSIEAQFFISCKNASKIS